jgi:hypothetical protein
MHPVGAFCKRPPKNTMAHFAPETTENEHFRMAGRNGCKPFLRFTYKNDHFCLPKVPSLLKRGGWG